MPNALQTAYLVLLGQIALIATSVFFGVPFFLMSPANQNLTVDATTTFYLVFVFCACSMMIVNILIGWAAVRETEASAGAGGYTNKMFILDLLIVICFFAMNNVIMFSFGDTLSMQSTTTIQKVISSRVDARRIAILGASLYALTSLFLLLCKFWNFEFYKKLARQNYSFYERMLWGTIVLFFALSFIAMCARNDIRVQIVVFIIWVAGWTYINSHWLTSIFKGPATQSLPPTV